MPSITLSYGSTTLVLSEIFRPSVTPSLTRNYTQDRLANDSIVYDIVGTTKKRWELKLDAPLSSLDKASLNTLFAVNDAITLTENFLESGSVYTVFFESKTDSIEAYMGDFHYALVLQEL